jgi:hypothetical protein
MPFMAGEGMAMDWVGEYSKFPNIIVSCNAPRMLSEVRLYIKAIHRLTDKQVAEKVIYLPNYYPQDYKSKKFNKDKDTIDICCFGAIRPLKNHLLQAHAAVGFAEKIGKKLNFHVNAGRIEMNGSPVINNLTGFFDHLTESGHQLINHQWRPRSEFLELCAAMDIGLQVSFSETFNIVGADLISQGVPLVGSIEIPWIMPNCAADPTDTNDIIKKLTSAYNWAKMNVWTNQRCLTQYTNKTAKIWNNYFS